VNPPTHRCEISHARSEPLTSLFLPLVLPSFHTTQTVREKCFEKCVPKPGTSLSSGEQTCIAKCTDRYVDATRAISNVVLQAYSQGQGGGMQ